MTQSRWTMTLLTLVTLLAACGGGESEDPGAASTSGGEAADEIMAPPARAVAEVGPTEGNDVSGTVSFVQEGAEVVVTVDLTGLPPSTTHGFHVHENGDCSAPDGTSAGGHYNPEGHDHALPHADARHAGDMGNLEADEGGEVHVTLRFANFSLTGDNAVLDRGVIVHASPDDGGQPTGNAGARVGCGVIRAAN